MTMTPPPQAPQLNWLQRQAARLLPTWAMQGTSVQAPAEVQAAVVTATQRLASRGGVQSGSSSEYGLHTVLTFLSTAYDLYTQREFSFLRISSDEWKQFFAEKLDPATARDQAVALDRKHQAEAVMAILQPLLGNLQMPAQPQPQYPAYPPQQQYPAYPAYPAPMPQAYPPQQPAPQYPAYPPQAQVVAPDVSQTHVFVPGIGLVPVVQAAPAQPPAPQPVPVQPQMPPVPPAVQVPPATPDPI